jgi:serine/threonine protein phosphatase 1
MSKYAIGDIHGNYKGLLQILKIAKFDYEQDELIILGDVVDGYPQVKECVDELLKIKKVTLILGNHDYWFTKWFLTGNGEPIWLEQGGQATVISYGTLPALVSESHRNFFTTAEPYLIDDNNFLYVHGGIDPDRHPKDHSTDELIWDRSLYYGAVSSIRHNPQGYFHNLTPFNKVFIGHTPIINDLMKIYELINLDTGSGWNGFLTMMNVNTEKIHVSDFSSKLYPDHAPREK